MAETTPSTVTPQHQDNAADLEYRRGNRRTIIATIIILVVCGGCFIGLISYIKSQSVPNQIKSAFGNVRIDNKVIDEAVDAGKQLQDEIKREQEDRRMIENLKTALQLYDMEQKTNELHDELVADLKSIGN